VSFYLANAYFNADRYSAAATYFRDVTVVGGNPDLVLPAYDLLAISYERIGRISDAFQALDEAIASRVIGVLRTMGYLSEEGTPVDRPDMVDKVFADSEPRDQGAGVQGHPEAGNHIVPSSGDGSEPSSAADYACAVHRARARL
jgi:hypothetical protein